MWRTSTDTLQVWTRVMIELESMAGQGRISRPGAWSFPDCLEVGVPGYSTLTWEETKSNVALFAVTSAPLILGNDVRPSRMQPRLLKLMLNADMLDINAQYNADHTFAGGRISTAAPGKEIWAKPLVTPEHSVAVVLFNRAGTVVGVVPEGNNPLPHFCSDPTSPNGPCLGCFVDADKPALSPCDDNVTASTGQQHLEVQFASLPRAWLGLSDGGAEAVSCDVFDVFDKDGASGVDLGRFSGSFGATVPPHGVRFLRLSKCG